MIILDQPYVSPELLAYAAARQEPVLDNYMARACSTFPWRYKLIAIQ